MPVTLGRRGVTLAMRSGEEQELRDAWQRHCFVKLPRFLAPDLLAFVTDTTAAGAFDRYHHEASGSESRLIATPGIALLDFLMNEPAVLRLVERLTGLPQLGWFHGRIYRLAPGTNDGHDWHGDHMYGRKVGVSINLTADLFQGGSLELREAVSRRPISAVANTGFGDCILFRLDDDLEHRVLPVTGSVPRVAYAGWFYTGADLKARFEARRGADL